LSKSRLGRMHEIMAGYVERGEVHVDGIGTKAVGDSDPTHRDTIMRITSMTKPITAVSKMILVVQCKLRLDESVNRPQSVYLDFWTAAYQAIDD
jgi:CubicO group peptidase (beta-lactamase class C family)